MTNRHPSRKECLSLLKEYETPTHVRRHCEKVAETAVKIATALIEHGCDLDLELIQATCLIHDIARVEDEHWEVGAKIAREQGYHQEAEIIKVHMFYSSNLQHENIKEIDIICLSDRMVKDDKYVGLEARMQFVLDKYQGNPEATNRILSKIKDNKALIQCIEEKIDTKIESLM